MAESRLHYLEEEMEKLDKVCESTLEYLEELICGSVESDPQTILTVAKTFGEIVDAKKDMAEKCYHITLIEAMEEHEDEYGETWDEKGIKYYPRMRRYHDGMMPEVYRDRDLEHGRMYYTEPHDMTDSRYEMSKRNYEEHKQMNPNDTAGSMAMLETFMRSIDDGMGDIAPMMNQNEKAMAKDKLMRSLNKHFA